MSAPASLPMTVDAFLEWAALQPERHELVEGVPVAMAPERAGHTRMKARIHRVLSDALRERDLGCEAFVDGMTVEVDERNAYEPDVVVHCGPRLPDDALVVTHPVIVVEVLSRSTRGRDSGAKLADYFRVPSVMHYLMVQTERFGVIHHARQGDGSILTRIVSDGVITLDPPGIAFAVEALLEP